MGNSLLDIIVPGRIAGKGAAEFSLSTAKDGSLNLDHVVAYKKEVEDAGVAGGRVAPALLPTHTDERIRERQLTAKHVDNVRQNRSSCEIHGGTSAPPFFLKPRGCVGRVLLRQHSGNPGIVRTYLRTWFPELRQWHEAVRQLVGWRVFRRSSRLFF